MCVYFIVKLGFFNPLPFSHLRGEARQGIKRVRVEKAIDAQNRAARVRFLLARQPKPCKLLRLARFASKVRGAKWDQKEFYLTWAYFFLKKTIRSHFFSLNLG